jgi:hypothetical protein
MHKDNLESVWQTRERLPVDLQVGSHLQHLDHFKLTTLSPSPSLGSQWNAEPEDHAV